MTRQLPIIIAFGLASAVLSASALGGGVVGFMVAYIAQLPLFVAGLSFGIQATAISGLAGIVALVVIGGPFPGVLFAFSTALPVSIFVMLALRKNVAPDGRDYWYSAGNLLCSVAIWWAFLLVCAAMGFSLFADGIAAAVAVFINRMVEAAEQAAGPSGISSVIQTLKDVLPGIIAWSWMVMATVNGLLAQAIVRRMNRNLRPSLTMAEVDIPLSWAAIFGVAVALSYVLPGDLGFVSANLAIIFAFPLFFQGLSVVHGALDSFGAWKVGYFAFYLVMIFFGWLVLALIALGMAEPVFKIRERLARPKST